MNEINRGLALLGGTFLLLSLLFGISPNWPRLPGDIFIDRPNLKVYIPLTSSIILSIVLSIILGLFRK